MIHRLHCTMLFILSTIVTYEYLTLLFHIHDVPRHHCIHLCRVPPRTWPKKAEICSRTAIYLYIIVSNHSSVARMYTLTCFIHILSETEINLFWFNTLVAVICNFVGLFNSYLTARRDKIIAFAELIR